MRDGERLAGRQNKHREPSCGRAYLPGSPTSERSTGSKKVQLKPNDRHITRFRSTLTIAGETSP